MRGPCEGLDCFTRGKGARRGGGETWRQYKKLKLFLQTQPLICSLSPRFLSMHCCYRFRAGEKKKKKKASCVSIKGALGFKYRWASGALGKEIAAGVFRTEQNCISKPRLSIDMHLGWVFFVFFSTLRRGGETRKVDWIYSCCRLTLWAETGGGLTLPRSKRKSHVIASGDKLLLADLRDGSSTYFLDF